MEPIPRKRGRSFITKQDDFFSRDATPIVGPWAQHKLELLQKYLSAYTTALSKQSWLKSTIYVDAFAGAGAAQVRRRRVSFKEQALLGVDGISDAEGEEVEYIRGSPRIALEIARPFSHYLFVEKDGSRAEALNELKDEWGGLRSITVHQGEASELLKLELVQRPLRSQGKLALVFLDPYGMHVDWSLLEQLGRTRSVEVIINFPLGMAIQRLVTVSGKISEANLRKLDTFFGTSEWHGLVYGMEDDLLGPWSRKKRDANRYLLELYCRQLEAAFGHVSPPRLIRNSRNGHLYYLIWAGPHERGAVIARSIFGQ